MRDRRLFREAKECERPDSANGEPPSPPYIHVAVRPYLGTVKHCIAAMPHEPPSVNSAGQTDRQPFANRDSIAVLRLYKRVPTCKC